VPSRNNVPLYFSVISGVFWTETVETASGDGVYYQLVGSVDLRLYEKTTTLKEGEGIFIPAGAHFTLTSNSASRPPRYLHFLLSPAPPSDVVADANETSVEIYRSPNAVPGLTSEKNVLSLTMVPIPPQSPPDPLHRRTGASLHYILSGVGAEFGEGRASTHAPGSISYEPAGYSYQWSNPGPNPLIYLLFNVNPRGLDPVVMLDQHPEDPFSRDPHLTLAMYCVALSMLVTLLLSSATIVDYQREKRMRHHRDKK
jgi:mannose-6-phosphate isomerase-like protein (cupin superfamily)